MKPKKKASAKPAFKPTQIQKKFLKNLEPYRKKISSMWTGKSNAEKIANETFSFKLERLKFVWKNGRKKAMLVKMVPSSNFFTAPNAYTLIYYPKPSEIKQFAIGSRSLLPGSPGRSFPGSLGIIKINPIFESTEKKSVRQLHIDYIQGSFNFRHSSKLSRSLVTKHGGWRQHLLDSLFKEASSKKIYSIRLWPRNEIQEKIFRESAEKNGFEVQKAPLRRNTVELTAKRKT